MNKIFYLPLSYSPELFEQLLPLLTEQEKIYISKYKLFNRRYESLIARIVIKKFSGANEIAISSSGQPYLPNSALHISIAHCEGAVLVGLSEHAIGVDIEPIQIMSDAFHFLHPKELHINSKDFLTVWTIKEAFVKWHTGGFSLINPTKIHCFKKENKWIINGYFNSVTTSKIDIFQATAVTLELKIIEAITLNEKNLMTF